MKRKTVSQEKIEEAIRFLDEGFTPRDVFDQFSENEREEIRAHVNLIADVNGMKDHFVPRVKSLEEALKKITVEEEPQTQFVGSFSRFFGRQFYGKLLLPIGAIAILGITLVSLKSSPAVTTENGGGEFAALMAPAPEADIEASQMMQKDALFAVGADTADLFDEAAILRETEKADEYLLAAEDFFAKDSEVESALSEF